jgi:hypothetical protein
MSQLVLFSTIEAARRGSLRFESQLYRVIRRAQKIPAQLRNRIRDVP